jgi:hypothetical protein
VRKSCRDFRTTGEEKRGFPLPHGSNMRPLALDPGTSSRCGCDNLGAALRRNLLPSR